MSICVTLKGMAVVLGELAVFYLCIAAARRFDESGLLSVKGGQKIWWLMLGACNGIFAGILCGAAHMSAPRSLWFGIAAGGLLFACLTDVRDGWVYDYTWWIVMPAGAFLLYAAGAVSTASLFWLAVFWLLQRFLFDRFYGRADVYGFCACAMLEASFGMELKWYLLHMAAAFLLLAVVQGIRRNIGGDGNLKRPVPFLPYIVFCFWGVVSIKMFTG